MSIEANTGGSNHHETFVRSGRTHILQITNHGVHEWKVVPGMPDTGGQNVYVNQFTEALIAIGYRVTIVNRGGYPHPATGEPQTGVRYHPSGHARIVYLEDGKKEFVRKEDMYEQLPALAADLKRHIEDDDDTYDLIISHYWDAGLLGVYLNDAGSKRVPHVWVPHSLGALKKRNMDPSTWADLRIDERIDHEKELMKNIDGGVATSTAIRDTFKNDYGFEAKFFLPPCVDEHRYQPRNDEAANGIYEFLAGIAKNLSAQDIRNRRIVTEISRTDKTKRKDVLIKAFAQVKAEVPDALLLVAIDPHAKQLHDELMKLIADLHLENDVIPLGSIWDQLPYLYNATSVYCTPSVMEGFGMSAQEAAATAKPVVSSDLVPFVVEYLVGPSPERVSLNGQGPDHDLLFGQAGIVVKADYIEGFAEAIKRLLKDDERRNAMGRRALDITIPYFTWRHMSEKLLSDLGVSAN